MMVRFAKLSLLLTAAVAAFCLGSVASAEDAPATPAAPAEQTTPAAASGEELVDIEFELPEPSFGGTPLNYFGPNLEPKSFKPREVFKAPKGVENVAKGKKVTSSVKRPVRGDLEYVTDGDKSYEDESLLEINPGKQWVQIDLEKNHEIFGILVWHFHAAERVYFDVVVQVAEDEEFTKNVKTLYNNDLDNELALGIGKDKEYIETAEGRLIKADGVKGRFVRLYSNGNASDESNHYVEVEVYGRPAPDA